VIKLDIITVHLDDFENIDRTLRSLEPALMDTAISWLVIDGGSSPDSSQQSKIMGRVTENATQFISESDSGIYNAMNTGTQLARGDYAIYLNAGDELHPEFSLDKITAELNESWPAMIWGTCFERFPDNSVVKVKNRSPKLAWYGIPVNHQNVMFRRDLLGSAPYNEKYRICADYDLICRLLKHDKAVLRTTIPIAIYQRGGLSSINFSETMAEEESLRTLHFGLNTHLSRGITYLKRVNRRLGSIPALRRILRKWV
jgi:putative colanic acid biosynthesis glycosyltransferase